MKKILQSMLIGFICEVAAFLPFYISFDFLELPAELRFFGCFLLFVIFVIGAQAGFDEL